MVKPKVIVTIKEYNGGGELIYVDEVRPYFDSIMEAEEWIAAYEKYLDDAELSDFYELELEVDIDEPH